jgi:hypothetical protein
MLIANVLEEDWTLSLTVSSPAMENFQHQSPEDRQLSLGQQLYKASEESNLRKRGEEAIQVSITQLRCRLCQFGLEEYEHLPIFSRRTERFQKEGRRFGRCMCAVSSLTFRIKLSYFLMCS